MKKATMNSKNLSLKILPDRMAVCRFEPTTPVPDWIDQSGFYSITRTEEELTIVCAETLVARGTTSEIGWRCFKVEGPLDFSEIGIIFSLTQPLARSGVSVFVLSTFDTDYLMVKEKDLSEAIDALRAEGHQVKAED
ncbi:MAG: ACT domain-containing protein [Desulfobacterales bacterium]|nr:ACT domain-containing protein [Desulfobacterales bacterium]